MEGIASTRTGFARLAAASILAATAMLHAPGAVLAWSGFAAPQYVPAGQQPAAVATVGIGGRDVAVASRGDNRVRTFDRNSGGALQIVAEATVGAAPDALLPITPVGATYPQLVAVADHDADMVQILGGAGGIPTGVQQEYSVTGGPDALAAVDVNGDGIADLLVASGTTGTVTVLSGTRGGTFTGGGPAVSAGLDPVALAATTLPSGAPLVAVADAGSGDVRLLSATHGVLVPVAVVTLSGPATAVSFTSVLAGQRDLVVTTGAGVDAGTGSLTVIPYDWAGNPLAPEQTIAIGAHPSSLLTTDVNGDGHVDFAVSDSQLGTVSTWLGDGFGDLTPGPSPVVGGGPVSLTAASLSSDGLVDLASADAVAGQVAVLAGQDPEILLSPNPMDFGPIPAGTTTTGTLTITNTGVTPLMVSAISLPSAPFSISADLCSGTSVSPGASCTVTVVFAPSQSGVFHDALNIDDNVSAGRQQVALRGDAT